MSRSVACNGSVEVRRAARLAFGALLGANQVETRIRGAEVNTRLLHSPTRFCRPRAAAARAGQQLISFTIDLLPTKALRVSIGGVSHFGEKSGQA